MQNLKITAFSFPLFLHFAFTCVVFLCTVPARGRVRGVYIPSKQACFCTYTAQPKATRFQTLLTHVYCHHQEVALLNSSTELNFSLLLKTSPWEWGKKTTRFQHPRTVPFSFSEARIISESAQKQRQNRTQVVVSTQRVIFPQRCDCLCFLFVIFLFKLVSWDWHILYSEKNSMKAISHSPVNAPGVCLLPPQKPQDGISEGIPQRLVWGLHTPLRWGAEAARRAWGFARTPAASKDLENFQNKVGEHRAENLYSHPYFVWVKNACLW